MGDGGSNVLMLSTRKTISHIAGGFFDVLIKSHVFESMTQRKSCAIFYNRHEQSEGRPLQQRRMGSKCNTNVRDIEQWSCVV